MKTGPGKLLNAGINLISYVISLATGKGVIYGMPVAAGIELTNHCNLQCAECYSGSGRMQRGKGYMDYALFSKTIDELRSCLLNINLYFQGESMMHPEFFRFVEACRGLNITLSTNGYFLTGENSRKLAVSGIRRLIVSLDGIDQESYSAYRQGGNLEAVMSGIRNISGAISDSGSGMKLEIQVLVNRYNETQIPRIRSFARENKAVLRLKSMQVLDADNIEKWLPDNNRYGRYEKTGGDFRIKSRLKNRCLRLWINPVITWDGKVVPCCFDKDAEHVMGDLTISTFRQVWHGSRFKDFRERVLRHRSGTGICCNCTSGLNLSGFTNP